MNLKEIFACLEFSAKKITAAILCILFLGQQTMFVPVLASEISGITPETLPGGNHQYNIDPSQLINNTTGIRHYGTFKLTEGDIANLIFKYGAQNIENFINLVDTRIDINGIINTMRDNGFYNGHAIFVSPMGMVVGASGVLNVGSLTAIAPNPVSYLKYAGYTMGEGVMNSAAELLKENGVLSSDAVISIPGVSDDVNLKLLKEADSNASIEVNGKIIARGDVELLARNIKVGSEGDNAGIVAGVGDGQITNNHGAVDIKMESMNQAKNLFNALVNNDVQSGQGFGRDNEGNIIIKAQSVKQMELVAPADKLKIAGAEYAIEQLFDLSQEGEFKVKSDEILEQLGLSSEDVNSALQAAINAFSPNDAADPDVIGEGGDNVASVEINNAVLASNNIEVNAVSKVDYVTQKGSSIFDRVTNEIAGEYMDEIISGGTFNDFEGSRAKASVTIGDGAVLKAKNNVGLKSLAQANTSIKIKSFLNPAVDTSSEGFYYLGSKTDSSVTVKDGAKIDADGDVNIIAASKNSLNLKIKNPTSKQDATAGTIANVPSIQVSVLKSVIEADTNAVVEDGAEISAKNVNVNAVNVTSDQSNLNSVANILKPQNGNENAGIAVAVSLKDTKVKTNAEVNGKVINKNSDGKQGNVSINAQNMHVASNVSKAEVKEQGMFGGPGIKGKIQAKIAQVISKYVKGIAEGLDALTSVGNALPSASTAVVVNNSNLSATAKAGSTAKIAADNVTVNANTVDMTINNASTSVSIPKSETSGIKPAPGVAVIVNSQNNNTQAIVDGADITANDTLKVNATTEQPMNQTTFEFALNLVQTAGDIDDLFNETGSTIFGFDASSDWDFRLLMQDLMNPANEVMFDIKNVMFDFKNSGGIGMAGLAGFFNNWAQSTSSNPTGVGLAASVVVSDVINNTIARIGDKSTVNAGNVIVNAANKVVQFNAAGDVSKLWKLTGGSTGSSMGMGGTVIVESVDSTAKAQIGDGAVINADEDVKLSSANDQDFLTVAMTGGKSTANNGIAITGTTIVQDIKGTTESSIGASIINARKLDVIAGTANISTVPTALEQLKKDPTADLDSDRFESGFEPDTYAPEIFKFTDADINLGIDSALGFADGDTTSTSTLVGSGLLQLSENSTAITDGISNMMITGALAQQTQADANPGTTSSSGVAVGASVNVSEFAREVNALIADGADITLEESLNVAADSTTQSLNIALAGAFAGGVDMKKEPGFIDQQKENLKNKADGYLTKLKGILGNVTSMAQASDEKTKNATGSDVNNKLTDESVKNGLKDGGGLGNNLASGGKVTTTANASTAANNMSGALAGSVNAQINNSTVKAEVGNATIKVGGDVDVTAEQKTSALNIGGGVAKASTVGAGAAVNFVQNTNNTVAQLGNSDGAGELNLTFTNNNEHNLNVIAEENNDNIQVAIGVGAAKGDKNNNSSTQVAAGGSFNTDVLKNSVSAGIDNAVINSEGKDNIAVNVDAENHSTSYKGAGGMSLNIASSNSSSIGGAIGGNLNLINKTTNAAIKNSEVNNASSVNVSANKQTDSNGNLKPTEELISVGVAGSVVTGGQSAYNFQGAIGVDVINNVVSALIEDSNINSAGNVDVIAKNFVDNGNITGALGFSKTKGVGLGIGTVVDVIKAAVNAGIKNSTVAAANGNVNDGNVNVTADAKEDLQFLAVNMGVTTDQTLANVNAIVNVLNNTVGASVTDSVLTSHDLNVLAGYDSSVEGITNADSAAVGKGNTLSGNAVVNILDSTVSADITGDDKTGKKITSTGNANVKANVNQNIDIVPVGVSVSTGGTAAVAGNVGVNVISNTTSAKVEHANININSGSMNVEAKDTTTSKSRGGTVVVDGKSAAVGGSILVEILDKDIDAAVRNSAVVNTGDLTVNALAENIFGPKETTSITADAILSALENDSLENASSIADWQMIYDLAGGGKAGVSGSMIAKVSQNQVNASITDSDITANNVTVKAENGIYTRNIVGNITAGGNAAVGGSMFVNVNIGNTDARIENSSVEADGDVLVQADSIQDFKTIMVVGGAGGTAAVNGSVNSNTAKDTTTALIKNSDIKKSDIKKSNSVTVKAKAKDDVESINLAAQGAGTASVGGIVYNNNYLNTVNAGIEGKKADGINSAGKVTVDAKSSESFSANIAMIGAGGTASVNGVAIVNVINSNINSYINDSVVKADSIDVFANHNFNKEKYGDKTNVFTEFMDTKGTNASSDDESIAVEDKSVDSDDLAGELLPTVIVLGVSAAGTGAISANTIVDTINAQTIASVTGSEISTTGGLNIQATADEVFYNALAGVAASGNVSAGATVNTNVLSNTTKAELVNSTVKTGDVNVNAAQNTNLNTVLFMAAGAGSGAGVAAVAGVNTISNNTVAKIDNSKILAAKNISVSANTNVQANSIGVAASGVGVGAGVNGLTLTNVSTGNTTASIENRSVIEQGKTTVTSEADTTMYNLIAGGTFSGTGASVGAYVPVNVLNNQVNAHISDSKLNQNAAESSVSATSNATLKTLVAVAGISGVGASVGASAIVNVIDNDVLAYVLNSTINGGDFAIKAEQISSLEGLVAAVQGGGISVTGNINSVTNTLNDRVKAYADNLTSTANLDIDAVSNETITYNTVALSGSSIAGITGAAIVNVISNQLEAYITNSTLNGGSVDIDTNQTITLDNAIVGGAGGGAAVGGGTIVNTVSNRNSAYINNSSANVDSINVNAATTENITSGNIMASVSAFVSGAVSALVNVLEGTTQAYINSGSNTITSNGAINVGANDTLSLKNLAGSVSASAGSAASASVNVNVINNAVKSELLGNGLITADTVDVFAESDINYAVASAAAAAGANGIAGTVSVTSIGDRFENSADLSETDASEYVQNAQTSAGNGSSIYLVENSDGTITVSNTKVDGAEAYEAPSVSLTKAEGTAKEGTVANLNANVTAKNGITVRANNSTENTVDNLNASAGATAVGASVSVTKTNYKTVAQIAGGNLTVNNGDVAVKSNSNIKVEKDSLTASAGLAAIQAGVDYFKNDAITQAVTLDGQINAQNGDVLLSAISDDVIEMDAKSVTAGLANIGASIALAETNNHTTASLGSGVNAKNLTIEAVNSSSLTTSMEAGSISYVNANAVVNKAESNAITEALINAAGKEINLDGDLNMKTATAGIDVTNNVTVGTASFYSGNVSNYGANLNSEFNTIVTGGDIEAKNVNIKSGLKANKNGENYTITDDTATVTASVAGKKASLGFAQGALTKMSANAAGEAKAGATGGSIKADNINILSKLNRVAKSESESLSISGAEIGAINLETKTSGKTSIDTFGSTLTANKVNLQVTGENTAETTMMSGSIALIKGSGSNTSATVSDNSNINAGDINADYITMNVNTTKNAKVKNSSGSISLVGIGSSKLETTTGGESGITTSGKIQNKEGNGSASELSLNVTDNSTAENEASNASYGFVSGSVLDITSKVTSSINNNINGNINASDIDITSNLIRTVTANATSNSGGLADISAMNLSSIIENGLETKFGGKIQSNTLDINSSMTNKANSYVQESSAGLAALAYGVTKNEVSGNAINEISFNSGTDIDSTTLNATANSDSQSYMHRTSTSKGMIIVKGGDIQNNMKGTSQIDINGGNIKTTGNMNFNVKNRASTPQEMVFTDDSAGFIARSGAVLTNNLSQSAKLNVNGGNIKSGGDLVLSVDNGTSFSQRAYSDASGFTAHNNASSVVTATINNEININGGKLEGKNVMVNMNSSNTLSSKAEAIAHHFAGAPSVWAQVNLEVNNALNVKDGAVLRAFDTNPTGTMLSVNFMDNSVQNITQYADLYAEASIATGSAGGGINFNTNNDVNIEKGGLMSSSKDVFVNFNKGEENLNSTVKYDKVSRLLFGIKIHDRNEWSSVASSASNNVKIDGTIKAGDDLQMKLTINKDGSVSDDSTLKEGVHYTKEESYVIGYPAGSDEAKAEEEKLQNQIADLQEQIDKLTQDKTSADSNISDLEKQIDSLKIQIAMMKYVDSLGEDAKISETEFTNVLKNILDENYVQDSDTYLSQLLQFFIGGENQTLYVSKENSDVIIRYNCDDDGKVIMQNGQPTFVVVDITEGETVGKTDVIYVLASDDGNGNYTLKEQNGSNTIGVSVLTFENFADSMKIELDKTGLSGELSALDKESSEADILAVLNKYFVKNADDYVADISSELEKITGKDITSIVNKMDIDSSAVTDTISSRLAEIMNNITQDTVNNGEVTLTVTKFGDEVLYTDMTESAKTSITNAFNSAQTSLENYNENIVPDLTEKISDLRNELVDYENQLAYVKENGLDEIKTDNGAFIFNDLNAAGGTISINAQKGTSSMSGTGEMEVSVADILINNYSNYDLVFNDLNVGNGATGVTVDGQNYAGSLTGIKHWNDNLRVFTVGTVDNLGCITINNLYDHNHPINNSLIGNIASDIIINGVVKTNSGDVKLYNESGDITINDTITANKTTVNMPQGSFTQNTRGKEYKLESGDTLFAGKSINISASKIDIQGNMQAGVADKHITITEDMLKPENLLFDTETGEYILVNLGDEGKQSVYMNDGNNIKAIYDKDTNTVRLFGTQISADSAINLNTTSGEKDAIVIGENAVLKHADGYGKISIENKTDAHLEVNGLENNYMNGGVNYTVNGQSAVLPSGTSETVEKVVKEPVYLNILGLKILVGYEDKQVQETKIYGNHGTIINLAENLVENADIKVVTQGTGDLNVVGTVSSGNITDGSFNLLMQTNGNLNILNKYLSTFTGFENYTQVETINTNGTVALNKKGSTGGVNIEGKILNKNGDVTITNEGADGINFASKTETLPKTDAEGNVANVEVTTTGKINNSNGNVDIDNKNGSVTIAQGAEITLDENENKNIDITTDTGKLSVSGLVQNSGKGNINLIAKGDSGLEVTKTALVSGNNGNIAIENAVNSVVIAGKVENNTGNVLVTNNGTDTTISGTIENEAGNTSITNEGGQLFVSGTTANKGGNTSVTNNGEGGIVFDTTAVVSNSGDAGKLTVTNNAGGVKVAENAKITNDSKTAEDNLILANSGSGLVEIFGHLFNKNKGNTVVTNTNAQSGIVVGVKTNADNSQITNRGKVENTDGELKITNNGSQGIQITGDVVNKKGNTSVNNTAGGVNVDTVLTTANGKTTVNKGTVTNNNGTMTVSNSGDNGVRVAGDVTNNNGKLTVDNKNGAVIIDRTNGVKGRLENTFNGSGETMLVQNTGNGGININGDVINNGAGTLNVLNNNEADSSILVTAGSLVQNEQGGLNMTNKGGSGIDIAGEVYNKNGTLALDNQNTSAGIIIESTGRVHNDRGGNILVNNIGSGNTIVQGIVTALQNEIDIINSNSDVIIGDNTDNDNYINAVNNNVNITVNNGNLLNSGVDKTLIKSGKDLNISVKDGDIGMTDNAIDGKKPGFSINASTRDKTESVNINAGGVITASAENETKTGDRLINLTAKDSDMKINQVKADGNVMLTAAEWDTEDRNPTPGEYDEEDYFTGYSIINAAKDKTQPNVIGKNISLISSNNIGSADNYFTYQQTGTAEDYFSAEAENDLYVQGTGDKTNIWQLITKRGNMGLVFDGNTTIRELTAGKDIQIVNKGQNLTIYDLGRLPHILNPADDLLYPHDRIELSSVVPETINIAVLDAKGGDDAYSTLNIYNAFVRGTDDDKADVVLAADRIIAHASEAPDSIVSNAARPDGFDASEGREYYDDPSDTNSEILQATGFNTSGAGSQLTFDITGVSPEIVAAVNEEVSGRDYNSQDVVQTIHIFNNDYGFTETVYKANDVTLSLNSASSSPTDNRGALFNTFYTDNAYVDTKDLNLDMKDAFVTNYGEFRNGSRGGDAGAHEIGGGYRWLTIVDNDYQRNISSLYGINLTTQLYTKLTGSYALHMGNTIDQRTKAPVVYYNPYEVVNLPRTENSFYRLTFKDDKIQKTTTTPEFEDIDKDTYKPTKRQNIRFSLAKDDEEVKVANKRIISILDISKGGLAVEHDGTLQKGEEFMINLSYHNITATPEVQVVRVSGNKAGLQFINMDNATANKILYINLFAAQDNTDQTSSSKATMVIERL